MLNAYLKNNRAGSILTEPELAETLKVSTRHLKNLRYARRIPVILLGRSVRYDLDAVRKALEKNFTLKAIA